ncbi:unnamed protein product, partial [Porites lobata]
NAACEKIKGSFVPLRKGYLERKRSIQDVLDRWSAHSSVGYALVVGFNAAVMLLMTTFAIEFAYHFRPYYWRIMMMIYSLAQLGLWLVFRQGMILMHNLIFLCFWLISGFFAGVRLTCLFLVFVASKASSAVTFVSWLFVRSASSVLNGFRVATSDSLPASALIRSNSQSPVCGVIALIVAAAPFFLVILAWRRRKQGKLGFSSKNLTAGLYHCPLPYCWQFRQSTTDAWTRLSPEANVGIEKCYCDVEKLEMRLKLSLHFLLNQSQGEVNATINFENMTMQCESATVSLRRLSTPSYIQAPGKRLATKWIWYWKDDNGWKEYDGKISREMAQENIEADYLNEEGFYFFHINRRKYMITLYDKSMRQRNMDPNYRTERSVRRRPKFVAESEVHSRTSRRLMGHDNTFKRIPLSTDSEEFKKVETLFHKTILKRTAKITVIEKIKNAFLNERYKRKREQIKNILKVSDNDNVERLLFHGTSSDVIDAICKHNFDHRCHGKNGTKYGKGSYFAVKASYSNNYCSGMTRFMFLARVLTGEFKQGDESLHRPPLKDPSNPASDLYDSCVDNESSPSIFVIFNDEQCYPTYLITYAIKRRV